MYFFFSVAKNASHHCYFSFRKVSSCYKLYQIIQTSHNFFQLCTCSGMCLLYSLLCHVIQLFPYFTLTKDGVNIIVYMTCLYLLLFCFKNKKMTRTQVWVKSQKLCQNCPAIYLFSWEGREILTSQTLLIL